MRIGIDEWGFSRTKKREEDGGKFKERSLKREDERAKFKDESSKSNRRKTESRRGLYSLPRCEGGKVCEAGLRGKDKLTP